MEPVLDFRNTNTLWGSVLVETLVRLGVRKAVVSPGSRSTPLAVALAAHPGVEAISILDERSAAFFALGQAKRAHLPVLLVCTSGTAGANYLPAVIEAHESNTPLVVITADRPPEMRDCASGQTVDQQKLFGGYAGFYHELAVPEARLEMLCYLRQTIAHAVHRARNPNAGPVHLNAPFRDPLAPVEDAAAKPLKDQIGEEFFAHLGEAESVSRVTASQLPTTTRGLIVAGPANPDDVAGYVGAVRDFSEGMGWPVLADALSPLRHAGSMQVPVVGTYDAILRNDKLSRDLLPRYVVCLEGWPTSKALRAWLEQSQAEMILVADTQHNRDALHGRTRIMPLGVEGLMAQRKEGYSKDSPARREYTDAWAAADEAAISHLANAFEKTSAMFEAKAAWLLGKHLPEETPVFVAGSMPVRDVEYFWAASDRRYRFFFNRGANGIDGTLSTALGVAHGGRPTVALTGDLALLHDTNGFLTASKVSGSLTIVLINNNGGGIFEHLPIASFNPPFEELFATPQNINFSRLCAVYDVEHVAVEDWGHFEKLISVLPETGVRVLELKTDRKGDAAARKKLLKEAGRAAGN